MMRRAIGGWLPHAAAVRAAHARWQSTAAAAMDQASRDIRNSYLEFWEHIRFRKGWATPPFSPDAVAGELDRAAKISADIMRAVDEKKNGPSFRKRGGDSVAFLSGVRYNPEEHRTKFVRELVHSTLSDARGYIDGLTEEQVDKEIARIHNAERVAAVATRLEDVLNDVHALSKEVPEQTLSPDVAALLQKLHQAMQAPPAAAAKAETPPQAEPTVEAEAPPAAPEVGAEAETETETSIDVTAYRKAVASLQDATKVEWDRVKKDPAAAMKELETVQNRCTDSTAQLMKDLLALEQSMSSSVSEGQAPDSGVKEQIQNIHHLLGAVDEVSRRIHVLKTATIQEKERQQAEGEQAAPAASAAAKPAAAKKTAAATSKQAASAAKKPSAPASASAAQQPAQGTSGASSSSSSPRRVTPREFLNSLATLCLDAKTWENMAIAPEFSVRNGPDYCLISAYTPLLQSDSVSVNINYDLLTISGTCVPSKMEVWKAIEPIVNGFKRNPRSMASILERDPVEVAQMLSQGKWGRFTKQYTLPAPVPPSAVRAQIASNVLSIAIPYTH